MRRPRVAISIGDPAGVGAEIALKALSLREMVDLAEWIVVGDHTALEAASPGFREKVDSRIHFVRTSALDPAQPVRFGELAAEYGAAPLSMFAHATEMCLSGEADAMVTAPR